MSQTIVVINEAHSILPNQKTLLDEKFPEGYEILSVPEMGWTKKEMDEQNNKILQHDNAVFVSPIPYMIAALSFDSGYYRCMDDNQLKDLFTVFIFHNDVREKKELPNGKIIFTVAKEGWELIEI